MKVDLEKNSETRQRESPNQDEEEHEGGDEERDMNRQDASHTQMKGTDVKISQATEEGESNTTTDERIIEKFFRVYWNVWMNKAKIFIIIFVVLWSAMCIWRITQFEPAKEALEMLSDDHWITKLQDSLRNDYHTGEDDDTIQVSFVWGFDGISKKGVGKWESDNRGTAVYDDDFDMSSTTNQQRILDI